MIAFLLLAASASAGPVLHSAEARSAAYRECIAAEHRRRPAATVVEIGRGVCARARSRLVAGVRDHVSYGWAATARTDGQARRLRAHMKQEAQSQVAAFEVKLQAWLAAKGNGLGSR
ncbi:MAG TPA: hypothetical protein VEA61_16150 [Allosphingosinicella sp.]|nr:hypothetical protein [Allosphingosinicella sp.]